MPHDKIELYRRLSDSEENALQERSALSVSRRVCRRPPSERNRRRASGSETPARATRGSGWPRNRRRRDRRSTWWPASQIAVASVSDRDFRSRGSHRWSSLPPRRRHRRLRRRRRRRRALRSSPVLIRPGVSALPSATARRLFLLLRWAPRRRRRRSLIIVACKRRWRTSAAPASSSIKHTTTTTNSIIHKQRR